MSTAAPQVTGEVLIGQLTDRLFSLYEQALECEEEPFEFKSMQRLIVAMGHKVGREFSALVSMLNRKDKFLDFWVEFEDELKNLILLVGDKMTLGNPEIVERVKGLLLSFTRLVKKEYGSQHAALISAKLNELESRRVAVGRK